MEEASRCSECGGSLIAGRCLACDTRRWARFVHREIVLLTVLIGLTIAAFFGTRAIANSNEALRRRQAAAWYEVAQRASPGASDDSAVSALRSAVAKDPQNRQYRLALADALAARGLDSEAERLLLDLREAQPEEPETNLRLARLEARGPDADATRRYYQNALSGLWGAEDRERRRSVRIELIQSLLAHKERARALSELLVLTVDLPQDPTIRTQVGRMFLAAGDTSRALDYFESALDLDAGHVEAAAGAGEAAFDLGDYARALRYLTMVTGDNTRAADLRQVSRLVLDSDPLAPRLRASERRKRLTAGFEQAAQRLATCSTDPSLAGSPTRAALEKEVRGFQAALALPRSREPQNLVDDGVDLIYRIEVAAERRCATPPMPLDRALLLLGRRHGLEEQ